MKQLFSTILITGLLFIFSNYSEAQGCVAIRSTGGSLCTMQHPEGKNLIEQWQLNIGYRYFKSFRHFVGTEQQKERVTENTEVINKVSTMDLSIAHNITPRLSLVIGFPVIANMRSQRARFGNRDRYKTHSFGIGDARISIYRWMLDPNKSGKGNFQIGLGIKLPTGDYKYQDYFPVDDSTKQLRSVDQSIQLGDGGTGIITEVNAFFNFTPLFGLYGNGYYLFNPREQNGVPTFRSNINEAIMSVPDQFMARLGCNYGFKGSLKNVSFSIGGRLEGIPVYDAIGGSDGFRRPGYIVSAEPGINLQHKKSNFYLLVPLAIVRSRTQSVPDKLTTQQTGVYKQGDAAFADYLINVGISTRF